MTCAWAPYGAAKNCRSQTDGVVSPLAGVRAEENGGRPRPTQTTTRQGVKA